MPLDRTGFTECSGRRKQIEVRRLGLPTHVPASQGLEVCVETRLEPAYLLFSRRDVCRWRSWSIEKSLNEAAGEAHPDEAKASERLGVSKASPKAWEQFHQSFLDNLAKTNLARQLPQRRPSGIIAQPSPPETSAAGSGDGGFPTTQSGVGAWGGGGGGRGESSVRGGQVFGDLFRNARHDSLGDAPINLGGGNGGGGGGRESAPSGLAVALGAFAPPSDDSGEGDDGCSAAQAGKEDDDGDRPLLRRQPHVVPEVDSKAGTARLSDGGTRSVTFYQQDYVDKMLRMHFTEFHNSQKFGGVKNDNASAFLGDELSVHRNNHFGAYFGAGSRGVTPPDAVLPLGHGRQDLMGRSPQTGGAFGGVGGSPPGQWPPRPPRSGGDRADMLPPPPRLPSFAPSPEMRSPRRLTTTMEADVEGSTVAAAPVVTLAATAAAPAPMPPAAALPPAQAPPRTTAVPPAVTTKSPVVAPAATGGASSAAASAAVGPVLLPLVTAACWSPNKRHWILPAVIAAFPEALLSTALRESPRAEFEETTVS
ncbi:unnamed protein product, partial [Phaeothamnion confervicola]